MVNSHYTIPHFAGNKRNPRMPKSGRFGEVARALSNGNKRVGFMAAYIFPGINGQELRAPEEHAVLETVALAAGDSTEADFAEWQERSCTKASRHEGRGLQLAPPGGVFELAARKQK